MPPPSLTIDSATRRVRLDPADPAFQSDPYAAYAAIRGAAPVFYWEQQKMWCFLGAEEISALLRDRRLGREPPEAAAASAAPGHLEAFDAFNRNSLLEREPPTHTRLRALVGGAFFARNIEHLRAEIARLAHERIDRFAGSGRAELIEAYAAPIPVVVIAKLLGVPPEMAPQLLDWSHRMVAIYRLARTERIERDAEAATREFSEFLRGYVKIRRGRPADDLISHLLAAEAQGDRLNEGELISTCILLLNAGHEATVHATGNAIKALLEHRCDPARVFADAVSTAAAVEECLRFDPPLHLFTRYVREELSWNGLPLKSGEQVGLIYGAANRDPARYPEPDRFDPGRSAPPHLGFGGGIHFCLGAPLARLELQVTLPILFSRLPSLRLAAPPVRRNHYPFHGLESLSAEWG